MKTFPFAGTQEGSSRLQAFKEGVRNLHFGNAPKFTVVYGMNDESTECTAMQLYVSTD
jgi:hypothetical protein